MGVTNPMNLHKKHIFSCKNSAPVYSPVKKKKNLFMAAGHSRSSGNKRKNEDIPYGT